jgi:nickel-type superoxide dismutase maturation protease
MLRRLVALIPLGRYQVEGESMAPAMSHGERVLVNKAAYRRADPRPGDLVVVRDPREPKRLLLKRIDGQAEGGWRVLGDNAAASTDSRAFGPVGRASIIGKVWMRY